MPEVPIAELGDLRRQVQEALSSQTRLEPAKHTCEELLLVSRQLGSLTTQLKNAAGELASAQEAVMATLEATRRAAAPSTISDVDGDSEALRQRAREELASASKERTKAQEELRQAKAELADVMQLLDSGEDGNMLARWERAKQELLQQEQSSKLKLAAEKKRHQLELLKLQQRLPAEEYPREKNRDILTVEVMFLRNTVRNLSAKADTRLREARLSQSENGLRLEAQDTYMPQAKNGLKYAQVLPGQERDIKTSKVHVQAEKLEPVAQQFRELTAQLEAMRAAASPFANEQVNKLVLQLRAQAEELRAAEAELQLM